MRVIFSAQAEQDLSDLFEYINDTLHNSIAAHNIVSKILHLSQKLSNFPEMGTLLSVIDAQLGEYRYLIADNYLLIYKIADEEVIIVRILYAKSNYVQLLQS